MLCWYLRWRDLCKTLARKCGRRELAAGIRGIFSIFHSSIFSISAQCTSPAGGDLSCTALSNTSGWNIIFAKRLWQPETFFVVVSVQTGIRGEQSSLLILLRIGSFNVLNNAQLVAGWKWWKFVFKYLIKHRERFKSLINWQFGLLKVTVILHANFNNFPAISKGRLNKKYLFTWLNSWNCRNLEPNQPCAFLKQIINLNWWIILPMPMYCSKYAFSFVGYNFNSFVLLFLGFIIFFQRGKRVKYICHSKQSSIPNFCRNFPPKWFVNNSLVLTI